MHDPTSWILAVLPGFLPSGPPVHPPAAPSPCGRLETPERASAPATDRAQELQRALADLGSGAADQRRRAERWLSAHLARGDFASVAAAAAQGSPELRGRLVDALSADRNLALAALFATERDASAGSGSPESPDWIGRSAPTGPSGAPALRELGEEALRRGITRWYGAAPDEASPLELGRFLAGFPARHTLDPLGASPGELLERIARRVDARLDERPEAAATALAVDPLLRGSPTSRGAPPRSVRPGAAGVVEGGFGELVEVVARAHGLRVRGFDLDGTRPLLLVEPAGARPQPLFERVIDWVRALEAGGAGAPGAARALAGLGWPAARGWLAERWSTGRDPAALQGLLLDAGRGRVAPCLARADGVRELLDAIAAPRARPVQQAELLRALVALGGIGAEGADLAPLVAERLGGGGAELGASRIAASRVLAAWGRAPEDARSTWRGWLSTGATRPAAERLAALHALASTVGPSSSGAPGDTRLPDDDGALLARARAADVVEPALGWMRRSGFDTPAAWTATDAPLDVRLALLGHLLSHPDVGATRAEPARAAERAAAGLVAELCGPDRDPQRTLLVAAVLARQRARTGADRTRRVVLGAALEVDDRARLALLAGAPLPGYAAELFAALPLPEPAAMPTAAALEPLDQLVLGALFALPEGDAYGEALMALVRGELAAYGPGAPPAGSDGMDAAWVAACRRALDDLRARGEDDRAEVFLTALRRATRASDHPLRRALRALGSAPWPPPPGARPTPLEVPFELRID